MLTLRSQYRESPPKEQLRSLVDYLDRATGWMLVGAGAFCLAMHETIAVVEHFEWKPWIGIVISLALGWICILLVLHRFRSSKRFLNEHD